MTKALAIRLQKVIYKIVDTDQVGYIKGRYIGENVRTIFDILNYTTEHKVEGFIGQMDFEKAFDSVEWHFLFKTLKRFNFGKNFIDWIKILYNDIYSCVGNNGYYSDYFRVSRSIRQGCPISALLFILVAEILAVTIRSDNKIKGIKINSTEHKLCLLADDLTLITKDLHSLNCAIKIINKFTLSSGLKLNLAKSEVIPIGHKTNKVHLTNESKLMSINEGPFKGLGIWFSLDQEKVTRLNFNDRIDNMTKLINIWKQRNLSIKGKIVITKTLLLPQLQFLFSMIFTPQHILKQIDELLFNYLWDNKPAKIKRNTIIAPIRLGGLGMVDVFSMHTAAKCMWIKRLVSVNESKWKPLMLYMLNIEYFHIDKNLDISRIGYCKSAFHKQVLESWIQVHANEPKNLKNALNQFLLYNRFIKIDRNILTVNDLKATDGKIKNDLFDLKIIDLVDRQGAFMDRNNFNISFNCQIGHLHYYSILSAIPRKWKKIIKSNIPIPNLNNFRTPNESITLNCENIKLIRLLYNRDIYKHLLAPKYKEPTAISAWIEIFPFMNDADWQKIFILPYTLVKEPYLQSFQFKIVNRVLNCNYNLYKWKIKSSNKCIYCSEIDTVQHHLYECPQCKIIWNQLKKWMTKNLDFSWKFSICEIIFGIVGPSDDNIKTANFLILITKYYISRNRSIEKPLYLFELLALIRQKLTIYNYLLISDQGDNPNSYKKLLTAL